MFAWRPLHSRTGPASPSQTADNVRPLAAGKVRPVATDKVRPAKPSIRTLLGWSRRQDGAASPLRIACIVFPAALFYGLAWIDYRVEYDRTRDAVATTTGALAEHAQAVVETVTLVLERMLDHIGQQDWETLRHSPATHDFLADLQRQLPQVEAAYLIDADGILAGSSRAYPMPGYDVRAQAMFAATHDHDSDGVVISAPMPAAYSGTHGFIISRRRIRDGKFDGIVAVTVSREYFDNFYHAVLVHPEASAAGLIRTDGALLVRFPEMPPGSTTVLPPSHPMLAAANAGRSFAVFTGHSTLDGRARIGGFRRLNGLPLLVGYSIARSVFLATWAAHTATMAVCTLLLSGVLLVTEYLVRRKTVIEHDTLQRLVEETERRRQAEAIAQQSQKMEALGRLTGGVAHDFNNLLAVIIASLELAMRRDSNPRTARLLQTAIEAAQRGAKLTAQMLTFSRKQEISLRPIDVNATVRGMDELLRRTLGSSIRLHYDLAHDLGPVLADKVQLEMALLNLAVNARDAMPGGGELTFRSRPAVLSAGDPPLSDLPTGDYVCLQIGDTGVGMPEDVRLRAHEPFYTTKGPGSGTGLGLSMVYGFVKELGGAVTFDSAVGVGTTVNLFLPKIEHTSAYDAPAADGDMTPGHAGRILLVDDDPGVRQSIREILEELGHQVVDAPGGAEALERLDHDRRFDLLVIDFAMPMMNGSQLAAQVTARWPRAPLLFVTGYVENDALRPWSERGYGTVRKPFTSHELATAVDRAIRQTAENPL